MLNGELRQPVSRVASSFHVAAASAFLSSSQPEFAPRIPRAPSPPVANCNCWTAKTVTVTRLTPAPPVLRVFARAVCLSRANALNQLGSPAPPKPKKPKPQHPHSRAAWIPQSDDGAVLYLQNPEPIRSGSQRAPRPSRRRQGFTARPNVCCNAKWLCAERWHVITHASHASSSMTSSGVIRDRSLAVHWTFPPAPAKRVSCENAQFPYVHARPRFWKLVEGPGAGEVSQPSGALFSMAQSAP